MLGWPDLMGQLRSEFAVLASQDGTDVTYVPNAKTTSGTDVGVAKTVTLNAGEALPVSSLSGDLSGSEVTSTKPVALFGGHECTFIPDENTWACDHLVEQIPPTSTWGKEFLTVPLKTRKGGDTFRMLASEDGTSVSVNGAVVATLDRGQVHQQLIDGKSTVSADKPILVAQYSNGSDFDGVTSDPFMMLVPPTEQFLSEYTFATPATGFAQNFVNVVTPTAAIGGLVLDGAAVPPGEFSQIGSTAFSGAQLDLTAGSHSMTSKEPFGIYVYGFDFYDSYGYPGGAAYAPINEVTALTMTPPTQKVLVNTEACVDTKVTDQFGDPLEPRVALAARDPPHPQPEHDIFGDAEMRKQRVGLEHHGDPALRRRHVRHIGAADGDRALIGLLEPRDQPQRGRFAAAGRAQQHQQRALVRRQADIVHGARRAPALGDVFEPDSRHGQSDPVRA